MLGTQAIQEEEDTPGPYSFKAYQAERKRKRDDKILKERTRLKKERERSVVNHKKKKEKKEKKEQIK
jgi:hypothetical protein